MEEAKFSINIRFNIGGYDSQFTARDDESGIKLLKMTPTILKELEKLGAVPDRRWEEVKYGNGNCNGNGKTENQQQPGEDPDPAVCPVHGKAKIKKSKYGGLYCTVKKTDGSFCDWKISQEELGA